MTSFLWSLSANLRGHGFKNVITSGNIMKYVSLKIQAYLRCKILHKNIVETLDQEIL